MKSLLTILSHVAHGYVGNRAITFPLQYMGWDVDAINTTNYSNHPGYGSLQGSAATVESTKDVLRGLNEVMGLSVFDLILTGYCPNADVLLAVKDEITKVIQQNRQDNISTPKWIVDPVLGDNGKLYVLDQLIPVYRDILSTGLVSLITPNQFEFETLSGSKITSWDDLVLALRDFADTYHVENIVISSVNVAGRLYCVAYSHGELQKTSINQISCDFNGCGDLFTALVANDFYKSGYKITEKLIETVLDTLHNVLQLSYEIESEKLALKPKVVKDIRIVAAKQYFRDDSE